MRFNQFVLNGGSLGAGTSLPWITADFYEPDTHLRLTGVLSGGIAKYGSAEGTLTLTGAIHAYHDVACGAFSGTLALSGVVQPHVWKQVLFSATEILSLSSTAYSGVSVFGAAAQSFTLTYTATAQQYVAVFGEGYTTFSLLMTNLGEDYYTGAAPEDRTFYMTRTDGSPFYMTRD